MAAAKRLCYGEMQFDLFLVTEEEGGDSAITRALWAIGSCQCRVQFPSIWPSLGPGAAHGNTLPASRHSWYPPPPAPPLCRKRARGAVDSAPSHPVQSPFMCAVYLSYALNAAEIGGLRESADELIDWMKVPPPLPPPVRRPCPAKCGYSPISNPQPSSFHSPYLSPVCLFVRPSLFWAALSGFRDIPHGRWQGKPPPHPRPH